MKISTDYLDEVLDYKQYIGIVERLADSIQRNCPTAQAVAFRGNSGALVGMATCALLRLPPLLIRKGSSHSNTKIEGAIGVRRFVIVDDFISSGRTVRSIISQLELMFGEIQCLGIFVYAQDREKKISRKGINIPVYRTNDS